jgi:hypothetical protein
MARQLLSEPILARFSSHWRRYRSATEALPLVASDGGIAAGTECLNPNTTVVRAEALSRKEGHVDAVASSRTGDPAAGDFRRLTPHLASAPDRRLSTESCKHAHRS